MKKIGKFRIEVEVENGVSHYKVTNLNTGKVERCDMGELNRVLAEMD